MHVIYCIDIDTRKMSVSSIYDIVLDTQILRYVCLSMV